MKKLTIFLGKQINLEFYIRAVSNYAMLSAEKELVLSKKLYYNSDFQAAKLLIFSHLRFVVHIAKNYYGYGLSNSDIIQEGNIGLMKAVRRFNPEVGVRLVSFAIHWIKAEIHEYVLRNWRIVRVATTKAQRKLFFSLRKTKRRLGWFNNYEVKTVAKELGVSSKDILEMESRMTAKDMTFDLLTDNKNQESSLKAPVLYLQDKSSNFINYINNHSYDFFDKKKLKIALESLDKRSKNIILSRWLNINNKSTLQKLANQYCVSAERVRQIEQNAIKKMRILIQH